MPMSAAEKQKKYRERLKKDNPQKYEEVQKKAKERAARHYEKKKSTYTEEQKLELRQKWKDDRRKAKDAKFAQQGAQTTSNLEQDKNCQLICRNTQRRVEYRLKQENAQLRLRLNTLSKGFKTLQKKITRQQKKIDQMQKDYQNVLIQLATEPEIDNVSEELEEKTPTKKVEELINNNIPHIETPKKEEIKKKLLEYTVLTESLKSEFKTANNTEKKVLRKVLDNNIVKKYKHKTKLRILVGYKSNLKNYRQKKMKTTALQKKIECFYNRDDVTRATAGKKEYRVRKKVMRQKRYLLEKLRLLHRKYITEVGQISFSTFKKYRPFYVLSPKIKDCESCACIKHSNMQFLVDELKSLNILKTDNLNEVMTGLVCDFNSKNCMYNKCNACSENKLKVDDRELLSTKARWFAWVSKEHEYEKAGEKKKVKMMVKTKKEGTLQDLLEIFNAEMKKMKIHIFNFYYQYNKYRNCIDNLKDDEACIHIDFSENFTCKYHTEIQAMHFLKEQITLHTGVIYIKGEEKPISFCSISPDGQHNPEAIWAHLDPVLRHLKSNYPKICTIHFFSDGPTTQYRQKKNFYLFSEKVYEYGFTRGTWSFFEAAHGKGAADGIGAVIKRTLDDKIAQGKDIPNAETAFDILESGDTTVKLFYIPSINIKPILTKLSALPQTMKIHQLITTEKLKLKHRDLSCFCGDPRGSCECHSPVSHSFLPVTSTNEKQPNTQKKIKKEKNVGLTKNSERRKKVRRKSISSSTEEDDNDIYIEYAESDATECFSDDSLSFNFSDDENRLITVLDEKTGVLKPKINTNRKVSLISTATLKKPDEETNTKEEKEIKIPSNNRELMQRRFSETREHIAGKDDDVTVLSQIRKIPENISSYDLRRSNIFGKTVTELDEEIHVKKPKIDPSKRVTLLSTVILKNPDDENNTEQGKKRKIICENEKLMQKRFRQTTEHSTRKGETDENKENQNQIKEEAKKSFKEILVKEEKDKSDKTYMKYNDSNNKESNTNMKEGDELNEGEEQKDTTEIECTKEYDIEKNTFNLNEKEGRKTIEKEENKQDEFILNINDSVMVRYFQRKTWKYFIGFITKIESKDGENNYKVRFLKTVKDSLNSVKFIVQRKLDSDIVTNISIVKKVDLIQHEVASKEYYLSDDFDMVYFN